jgi:hypothetical protein
MSARGLITVYPIPRWCHRSLTSRRHDANRSLVDYLGQKPVVLFDDPKLADNPKAIPVYLRAKGSWFVIDKTGAIRATKIVPISEQINTNEILQVLQDLPKP